MASDDDDIVTALGKLLKPSHSFEWEGAKVRLYRGSKIMRLVWVEPREPRIREVAVEPSGRVVRAEWMDDQFASYLEALLLPTQKDVLDANKEDVSE